MVKLKELRLLFLLCFPPQTKETYSKIIETLKTFALFQFQYKNQQDDNDDDELITALYIQSTWKCSRSSTISSIKIIKSLWRDGIPTSLLWVSYPTWSYLLFCTSFFYSRNGRQFLIFSSLCYHHQTIENFFLCLQKFPNATQRHALPCYMPYYTPTVLCKVNIFSSWFLSSHFLNSSLRILYIYVVSQEIETVAAVLHCLQSHLQFKLFSLYIERIEKKKEKGFLLYNIEHFYFFCQKEEKRKPKRKRRRKFIITFFAKSTKYFK